ncbi:MAG TPA: hypothetical protein VFT75_07380 [Nocardioidaceae bacterium]|jgi:hypothetical protein|nr:hypothetical protein [Nocardioidaceae bacterium]
MTLTEPDQLSAGDPAPHRGRWLLVGLVVAVLVIAGVVALVLSRQQATPQAQWVRFAPGENTGSNTIPTTHKASYAFQLMNLGDVSATITNVGRSGPGLDLLSVGARDSSRHLKGFSPKLPITVGGHKTVSVTLEYKVLGCDGLGGRPWPIPVTFRNDSTHKVLTQKFDPGTSSGSRWYKDLTSDGMCASQP